VVALLPAEYVLETRDGTTPALYVEKRRGLKKGSYTEGNILTKERRVAKLTKESANNSEEEGAGTAT